MFYKWRLFLKNVQPLSSTMLGILFAILCILIFGGGVVAIDRSKAIALADYIQIVIMIFIAGTMFVAIRSHSHEKRYAQSATNLESALSLIDRAAQVLQVNGVLTNDRVSWVTCARLLARAESLRDKITTDTHRLIFDAEHDFQRHYFRALLRPDDKDLTGSFFCGGDSTMTIGHTVTSPVHPADGKNWIPERIVSVVYKFVAFPEGYRDPLDSSEKVSAKTRNRLKLLGYDGVSEYLSFRKNFFALGTQIRAKNSSDKTASKADDIDSVVFSDQYDLDE